MRSRRKANNKKQIHKSRHDGYEKIKNIYGFRRADTYEEASDKLIKKVKVNNNSLKVKLLNNVAGKKVKHGNNSGVLHGRAGTGEKIRKGKIVRIIKNKKQQ